jgi:hypothetical protein
MSTLNNKSSNWDDFTKRFEVPSFPNVYVLGCFARYQTLYSQQVRALNLVAGLFELGRLKPHTQLAIIGGGAAGLMAATAAAFKGAKVTLFEQLEGPMELQRNNRQRWLHPRIYDWPKGDWRDESAGLPLISWKAGYAENVASQIERHWRHWQRTLDIVAHWDSEVQLSLSDRKIKVLWNEAGNPKGPALFQSVILAVGFGLEPDGPGQSSYWDEDDIDGSFRKLTDSPKKWLVSGCGDGGLTDLIRLCLRRFRHEEVAKRFATASGIDGAIKELDRIHSDPRATESSISEEYAKLTVEEWKNELHRRRRQKGPRVYWAARSDYYGPGASVLNRLIAAQLCQASAFQYRLGPTKKVKRTPKGDFEVLFGDGTKERFDRVILRHGPLPCALEKGFPKIWTSCQTKIEEWRRLKREEDPTIVRNWEVGFFGVEPVAPLRDDMELAASLAEAVGRLGFRTRALTVSKEIRTDGSASLRFRIEGLTVTKEGADLMGLRRHLVSSVGQMGSAQLDEAAERLGIRLVTESNRKPSDQLEEVREQLRRLDILLQFPVPLKNNDSPLTFGFSAEQLNGDALSKWQFENLYEPKDRCHFDGRPDDSALEYFAWISWLPTELLQFTLTLPDEIGTTPRVTQFMCPEPQEIDRPELVRDGVIESFPGKDSRWNPWKPGRAWTRLRPEEHIPCSLTEISRHSWRLSIPNPPIGSCFSLDWQLPAYEADREFQKIENEVKSIRERLLAHGASRRNHGAGDVAIRQVFGELSQSLKARLNPHVDELFEVSMLVYDENARRLLMVESEIGGKDPSDEWWQFWLPFGLGLGGACFKEGERAFIYERRSDSTKSLDFYLPLSKTDSHSFLIAIPVDHPNFADYLDRRNFGHVMPERARQCIAVFNVGSRSGDTRMGEIVGGQPSAVDDLGTICQKYCNLMLESKRIRRG